MQLWGQTFKKNNSDFAWLLRDTDKPKEFQIVNDFDTTSFIAYDPANDALKFWTRKEYYDRIAHNDPNLTWQIIPTPNVYMTTGKRLMNQLDPFAQNLIGEFYGENYIPSKRLWKNTASLIHITTDNVFGDVKNDQNNAVVYGNHQSGILFPRQFLSSSDFTLIYIAKYNGAKRQCIFRGLDRNHNVNYSPTANKDTWFVGTNPSKWQSCFYENRAGVAHRDVWITRVDSDIKGTDWVLVFDQADYFRINGVNKTYSHPGFNVTPLNPILSINIGPNAGQGGPSDWAVTFMMIYDIKIPITQMEELEKKLKEQYKLNF